MLLIRNQILIQVPISICLQHNEKQQERLKDVAPNALYCDGKDTAEKKLG